MTYRNDLLESQPACKIYFHDGGKFRFYYFLIWMAYSIKEKNSVCWQGCARCQGMPARIDHNGVIIKDSRAQDQDQRSCAGVVRLMTQLLILA